MNAVYFYRLKGAKTTNSTFEMNVEPCTAGEYEAAIDRILTEIKRMNEMKKDDRAEIKRLTEESARLKVETRNILTSMGAKI